MKSYRKETVAAFIQLTFPGHFVSYSGKRKTMYVHGPRKSYIAQSVKAVPALSFKLMAASCLMFMLLLTSCEYSTGTKSGTLQKASCKNGHYYEAQIAFAGGKSDGTVNGTGGGYNDAQDFTIDKTCFDSIQKHVGNFCVIRYVDTATNWHGPDKIITSINFR